MAVLAPNPFGTESARVPPARKGRKGKGKALEATVRPELRRSACEAIDRWEETCQETVLNEKGKHLRLFCDIHEAESETLRLEYERQSRIPLGDRNQTDEITGCLTALLECTVDPPAIYPARSEHGADLETLAESEGHARKYSNLVDKAMRVREYYTTHFVTGSDDWGTSIFDFQRLGDQFEQASYRQSS